MGRIGRVHPGDRSGNDEDKKDGIFDFDLEEQRLLDEFKFFWRSECFGKRDGRKTQTPEASEIRVSNDSFKLRNGDKILRGGGMSFFQKKLDIYFFYISF